MNNNLIVWINLIKNVPLVGKTRKKIIRIKKPIEKSIYVGLSPEVERPNNKLKENLDWRD